MPKVAIVTDSTNCLPPELIRDYDIRVGSLNLVLDGRAYRDQVDITPAKFYRMYRRLKEMPTTVAVSPGDFAVMFHDLARTTDSIVVVVLSKAMSATYASAEQARRLVLAEHPNLTIKLVDSKTAAGALGFVALEAARAAQAGHNLAEVVRVARDMVPRVKLLGMLETLKYLIKGGRPPRIALMGDMLGVKPIIGLVGTTGKVDQLGRVRTRRKALGRMVDMIREYADPGKPLHVNVHYSESREDGHQLREMITAAYDCAEVYLTEFTPVMSCHTGPMMGVTFFS